ncbi:MAG: FHA domain-containing protein [Chloroflexota bacterium]
MSVEIWYGRLPETGPEQDALLRLYRFLEPQSDHFLVMTQFHAGEGNEIDWVIIKPKQIFIIEQKHVTGRLVGDANGSWSVVAEDGTETDLRSNPVKQIRSAYFSFRGWCQQNNQAVHEGSSYVPAYDKGFFSAIVITPDLQPGSQVVCPQPIGVYGLENFMQNLVLRTSTSFNLSLEEMQRFPRLLSLTQWKPPALSLTRRLDNGWKPQFVTGLVALSEVTPMHVLDWNGLGKPGATIGRDSENDLVIEDETVSRFHARLFRQGEHYVLEDLKSENGTWVTFKFGDGVDAERRVFPGRINAVQNGSLVRFGQVRFIFLIEA